MYNRQISTDWDFKLSNTKEYTHCFHNYPAMMIPQIARKLIEEYSPDFKVELIFDPYMGSGTTLVEASIKGINSVGFDVNPLARFIARSKITKFSVSKIEESLLFINKKIECYYDGCIEFNDADYKHITKSEYWYSSSTLLQLKYLSDIINGIPYDEIKAFFQISLSEVIREASYTRNGEFKRYRIAEDKISQHNPKPFLLFLSKIERNIEGLKEFLCVGKNFNAYIYDCNSIYGINEELISEKSVDMVITSPPYGDSKTTVAYGQFSRWSSEWFKFENAKNIDKTLMGGVPNRGTLLISKSISKELLEIKNIDNKRYIEVITFLDEYKKSIINVSKTVKKGGRVCYVVGNRNVKGVQIPLDYFTAEIFEDCGFKHETTFVRSIPNKRMPSKTSPTNQKGKNVPTMSSEYIVILTKL